ncbi:coiled-coil domain-containing protein 103 [Hyposmocoma kahamanoa]|uniref:coiled-coil domain-containing protein 103 n=1 Tax=Hyposmocoma kahamanoa TaxID=1477025 RepID=UPI000E6D7A8E|nr:coiled-coil domain-containing protein 103 [Hyposmocoma kahamanoa]
MNKLSTDDFKEMEKQLRDSVEQDRRYSRVNDIKCDAIYTAKTYEEFADRVATAHLQPMSKKDFNQKATLAWNKYATKEKNDDE